jgi:hypothetical protein
MSTIWDAKLFIVPLPMNRPIHGQVLFVQAKVGGLVRLKRLDYISHAWPRDFEKEVPTETQNVTVKTKERVRFGLKVNVTCYHGRNRDVQVRM